MSAFVNKGELWKAQKDLFGGLTIFFFPERGHVAAFRTLKAKWFATLNLEINGKIDKQVVLMFSTTNEKTLRLVKDLILNKNPKSY